MEIAVHFQTMRDNEQKTSNRNTNVLHFISYVDPLVLAILLQILPSLKI